MDLSIIAVFVVGLFSVQAKLSDYYSIKNITSNDHSDWMSRIPNSRAFRELSIPGTHNSVSYFGGFFGQCQSLPLPEQFKAGIRFLDIRCRHAQDELPIYHGIMYQNNDFDGVLNDTVRFLNQHPEEVIFMRIRQESSAQDNTESMITTIRRYISDYPRDRFWNSVTWPSLREARGKIVILQNFDTHHYIWVPYGSLSIDDHWNVPGFSRRHLITKWRHINAHLLRISRGEDNNKVHLVYSSGAGFFAFPYAVARRMNKRLWKFFKFDRYEGRRTYGIIGMDFPADVLINQIINSNFHNQNRNSVRRN